MAAEGRTALTAGGHQRAAVLLRDALALWRGPALPDLPDAHTDRARLEELRLAVVQDRTDAELGLGGGPEPVPGSRALLRARPLDERLYGQLMRALYAAGRSVEALAVFEEARRSLADELGADPSPALSALHLHLHLLRDGSRTPARPHLPAQLTRFVGRGPEPARIDRALTDSRLVTLTGPGGRRQDQVRPGGGPRPDRRERDAVRHHRRGHPPRRPRRLPGGTRAPHRQGPNPRTRCRRHSGCGTASAALPRTPWTGCRPRWRTVRCCWCSTTASTWSSPPRARPRCSSVPAPGSASWRPAGSRWATRARCWCRCRRCPRSRPYGCCRTARGRCGPMPTATRAWRRSAGRWTGCRRRSNWRRPGCAPSRWTSWRTGCTTGSGCSRAGTGPRRPGTARRARWWSGAGSCWTRRNGTWRAG
ncbi:AfsR/SARP family transcriptional regulator [Streptomyces olivaceoviridis]